MEGKRAGYETKVRLRGISIVDTPGPSAEELCDLYDRLRRFIKARYGDKFNDKDLAMETLLSVLSGHRHCNPNFDLFQDLCWKVRSIASNQWKKQRREESLGCRSADHPPKSGSPAEAYEAGESITHLLEGLLEACAGEPTLCAILRFVFAEGEWNSKRIATELRLDRHSVYTAKKQIKTKLKLVRGVSEP